MATVIKTNIDVNELCSILKIELRSETREFFEIKSNLVKNRLALKSIIQDKIFMKIINKRYVLFFPIYLNKVGDYLLAIEVLGEIYDQFGIDDYYKFVLADTLHLLNYYDASLILINQISSSNELMLECGALYSHVQKHLGNFSDAIQNLDSFITKFKNADFNYQYLIEKKASILYFVYLNKIIDRTIKNKHEIESAFEEAKQIISQLNSNPHNDVYNAALTAYNNPLKALSMTESCLNLLVISDDRFVFNAYYVKAEILRKLNRFDEAYYNYGLASGIYCNHIDINLIDQCYFSAKYLEMKGFVKGTLSTQLFNKRMEIESMSLISDQIIQSIIKKMIKQDVELHSNNHDNMLFNKSILTLINNSSSKQLKDYLDNIMIKNIFVIL